MQLASMLQEDEQVREQGHRFQGTLEKNMKKPKFNMFHPYSSVKGYEAPLCRLF